MTITFVDTRTGLPADITGYGLTGPKGCVIPSYIRAVDVETGQPIGHTNTYAGYGASPATPEEAKARVHAWLWFMSGMVMTLINNDPLNSWRFWAKEGLWLLTSPRAVDAIWRGVAS